jgi:ketosteroid isomerase-like protein
MTVGDSEVDARTELTNRVKLLEDQVALFASMSSYGPAVDSLSIDEATSIWTEDGVYDTGGPEPFCGRDEIAAMLTADPGVHRELVGKGAAHVLSMPLIRIDGDVAVGLAYHHTCVRDGDGHKIWRQLASRWDWVRQPDGWKVKRRTQRLLDGSEDARQLLRETLREIQGPAS